MLPPSMTPRKDVLNSIVYFIHLLCCLALAVGGNIVNIVLDPILMFLCGFGITGAAGATVIAQ